ncbi:hypothetical protein E0L36_21950 [Streptomyces sp. AJS327]|uniref:hypothetical protein n=1 Tax=Streptomyces sp. AJS327 TaxID=2545265 RepID=UPI0015DE9DB4|nr:hypothetical protein [Streptomyces sp. AJS327]MBA0053440.1 hypothetical protein [Streptomyces sp. AJS327]
MLGWKRKAPKHERQLAWRAQFQLATRAPFVNHGADSASQVGEALYDSGELADALRDLAHGVNPNRPFIVSLVEAEREVIKLADMRPSWINYCNERSGLDPSATDANSEMSRQYVNGDAVRAWPLFDDAQAVVGPAAEALRKLQKELASFCGSDITRGKAA